MLPRFDPALLPLPQSATWASSWTAPSAYSQAANLADGWGLAALVKYFDAEAAQEVTEHVTLIREYLRDRYICHLPAVAAPGVAEDLTGLLTDLLALIREVTANLNAIVHLARLPVRMRPAWSWSCLCSRVRCRPRRVWTLPCSSWARRTTGPAGRPSFRVRGKS